MTNNQQLWTNTLAEIELEVSKANFVTWFKNTYIQRFERETIYLCVPNTFVKDWLANKYHKFILKALRKKLGEVRAVEYIISKEAQKPAQEPRLVGPSETIAIPGGQLGLEELYVNKEDNLNPKYVFDNFIVGSFNELAHAASQAVIKNPGISYNPLYIYGGTGVGKTHLIQAVGNYFKKTNPNKKVHYLTTEKFTVDFVEAIKNNKAHLFKERYRRYDVLIMDDVQFIAGKERSQEELFHLFNTLYDNNRQIIFSSDKPPKQISGLEDRLKSRFEGGMIADIAAPDYESRLVILKTKTKMIEYPPAEEIVEYIASVIQNNIRELEGVLNLILVHSQLKKRSVSLAETKTLIKNSIKPQKSISINDVIRTIANFYNVQEAELYEKTRKKEVVKPRQVVMYILREDFNTSYPFIGQKMGGRDHTTVIHAYEKIKNELRVDSLLAQEIDQIKHLLYNSSAV